MLDDQDYMGGTRVKMLWPATMALLVANAIVYVFQYRLLPRIAPNFDFETNFALSLDGLRSGHVWQLLTYQFMHGGFWHIFLNCWAIFVFGRVVEEALGTTRMLTLYFLSGVVGGLVQMLCAWSLPEQFGDAGVVGASAGAFGLVTAFVVLFPTQELLLLPFFIVMRARTLLWISVAVAVLGVVLPCLGINLLDRYLGNVAHAAHLGGILTGFLFAHLLKGLRMPPFLDGRTKSSLKVTPAPD